MKVSYDPTKLHETVEFYGHVITTSGGFMPEYTGVRKVTDVITITRHELLQALMIGARHRQLLDKAIDDMTRAINGEPVAPKEEQ